MAQGPIRTQAMRRLQRSAGDWRTTPPVSCFMHLMQELDVRDLESGRAHSRASFRIIAACIGCGKALGDKNRLPAYFISLQRPCPTSSSFFSVLMLSAPFSREGAESGVHEG